MEIIIRAIRGIQTVPYWLRFEEPKLELPTTHKDFIALPQKQI